MQKKCCAAAYVLTKRPSFFYSFELLATSKHRAVLRQNAVGLWHAINTGMSVQQATLFCEESSVFLDPASIVHVPAVPLTYWEHGPTSGEAGAAWKRFRERGGPAAVGQAVKRSAAALRLRAGVAGRAATLASAFLAVGAKPTPRVPDAQLMLGHTGWRIECVPGRVPRLLLLGLAIPFAEPEKLFAECLIDRTRISVALAVADLSLPVLGESGPVRVAITDAGPMVL